MSEPERRSNHGGEAPKTDWALEVRRRREAVPTAQLEALKQRVGREFAQALRARQAGNEGRARVCARRAAGWAIAELFAEQASTDERRKRASNRASSSLTRKTHLRTPGGSWISCWAGIGGQVKPRGAGSIAPVHLSRAGPYQAPRSPVRTI